MRRRWFALVSAAALAVVGVAALGWHWLTHPARPSAAPPEATTAAPEHTYLGLPTSHWRDRLNEPSVDSSWPPSDFPLCEHPHRDAIPVLQDLLADPDWHIREAAAVCLGLQPSPEDPVVPLLVGAVSDPHRRVRIAAMWALSRQGRAAGAASPALLAAMGDDGASVRFQAARAFYDITGQAEAVLPALIRNLSATEGDWYSQTRSAYMLGELGPRAAAAADALVRRLQDDSAPPEGGDPDVIRRAVLEALGDIGPDAKSAVPAIRPVLQAPNGFVRASACVAFWKITGQVGPAVEPLLVLLEQGDEYSKRQSATGLGRMGPAAEVAVPALVRALKDAEWGVRWDAAIALGRIGPKAREAVPAMVELLKKKEYGWNAVLAALKAIDAKAAAETGVSAPDPPP